MFFTTKVRWLPLNLFTLTTLLATSILIGVQSDIIMRYLPSIHRTFGQSKIFSQDLERELQIPRLFHLMIIAFVTFVIYELTKVWKWKLQNGEYPFFYLLDPNHWSLLLDIFTGIVKYFMLFLLIVILWIMIKLTLIENDLNKKKYTVTIDIFDSHEIEELKHLRSYVLSILSNYIIVISLFIISDINFFEFPSDKLLVDKIKTLIGFHPFESIMVILMLLIGIILFITTQKMIQKIIDKSATLELAKINRIYREINDKVCECSSNKKNDNNLNELEEDRIILDILEKEETRIRQIKGRKFDTQLLITILATLIIPIISLVIQAWISITNVPK